MGYYPLNTNGYYPFFHPKRVIDGTRRAFRELRVHRSLNTTRQGVVAEHLSPSSTHNATTQLTRNGDNCFRGT